MDSKHAIELEKWEIKDLTAENAVKWLVSASFISGHTAMFGLANFIQQQDKSISDLQARLRELDEKNQTQAQVLAARDKVIERQERMIGMACEWLQKLGCPVLDDHYCDENCSTEMNGSGCWRRWLEQEAQHD